MGLEHMALAAHSAGAALAMLYAARYPHRTRRLVLIAPDPSALGPRATPEDRPAAARLRPPHRRGASRRGVRRPARCRPLSPAGRAGAVRAPYARLPRPVRVLSPAGGRRPSGTGP
ncbi:alpha/beta fold hydrolase [Streptomyces tricolor]